MHAYHQRGETITKRACIGNIYRVMNFARRYLGVLFGSAILAGHSSLAGEIRLTASNPLGITNSAWPVTIGVPFPAGELPDARGIALYAPDGQAIPVQYRPLTRWWGRDGSVQVLLVTFIADSTNAEYRLAYGLPECPAPRPAQPVVVSENKKRVVVTNGPLRAVINKHEFRLFDELYFDADGDGRWSESERVIAGGGLTQGALNSFKLAPEQVAVEECGPVRSVIMVRGRYGDGQGHSQLSYLLRMSFYAGCPLVLMDYTFLQDDGKVFVDVPSLSLDIGLAAGARKIAFGVEGESNQVFNLGAASTLNVLQVGPRRPLSTARIERDASPEAARVLKRILEERKSWRNPTEDGLWERDERQKEFSATWDVDGKAKGQAKRCSGWMRVAPEAGPWALTAGIRWFPDLHPKGLRVEKDQLRLFMAPELPQPLHLHLGTAKTHTVFLAFHRADDSACGPACAALVNTPLLYFPSPQWMCNSKVWGPLWPRTTGKFRYFEDRVAREIQAKFTKPRYPIEELGGMLNYGDTPQGEMWNNMETAFDYGVFVEFLRTGERIYYDFFEKAVAHFRDVDVCHSDLTQEPFDYGQWLTPGYMPERLAAACATNKAWRAEMIYYLGSQPPYKGGIRRHSYEHYQSAGTRPGFVDCPQEDKRNRLYSGTCEVGGHGWNIGITAHYMLTGDRYSLETAELTGQLILDKYSKSHWGRDNWKNIDLVHLYRATGKEAYQQHILEAIDYFYENRNKVVEFVGEQKTALMSPWYTIGQFIRDYYDLTGDEEVAWKFVAMVDTWIDAVEKTTVPTSCGNVFTYIRDFSDSRCHGDFADLAYAAQITGDPAYIRRGLNSMTLYLRHAYHSTAYFEVPVILPVLDHLGLDPLNIPPAQPGPAQRGGSRTKYYVKKDQDKEFAIHFYQNAGYRVAAAPLKDCAVTIKNPEGKITAQKEIVMGGLDTFAVTVPADGKTGRYEVDINTPGLTVNCGCDLPFVSTNSP